jgi:hypothetical protein
MMAWVQIDGGGKVTGIYGGPQPNIAGVTSIPDNDARVVAFLTPGKPQRITSTQFLNRLPPAVLPGLTANPQTLIMLITLAAAGDIDLTDPAVAAGINALVPSVLTAAQAAAALDH